MTLPVVGRMGTERIRARPSHTCRWSRIGPLEGRTLEGDFHTKLELVRHDALADDISQNPIFLQ